MTAGSVKRRVVLAVAVSTTVGAAAQVDKPVRILVGFAAGGSADVAARLIAEQLAGELKQPVVVENRPGAGGRIAAEQLKHAAPDGCTLMLAPIVVPVLAPLVFSHLSYDPGADFAPVAHVANFQFALSVSAGHPARSVAELLEWYRRHPGEANFGSPAPGSLPHFFGVMLSQGAGLDLVHVPFNGAAPLMNALLGNQVSAAFDAAVDQIEMHRSGRTRILATTGARRSPLLPEVPTFAEAGLRSVEGTSWYAVLAPARTPTASIQQLNAAINKALSAPALRERFQRLGLEPTGGTAAELDAIIRRDTERWAPVVRASGFRGD